VVNYGGYMILLAQTDPAWEYWDTSTYLAIAMAFTEKIFNFMMHPSLGDNQVIAV